MSDRPDSKREMQQTGGFRILLTVSMLFLAVVLAINAIGQLRRGAVAGGIIGLLGTALFALVGIIVLGGLVKSILTKRRGTRHETKNTD